ncbi:MAG: D-alanyl-D-alanine carboxypeptidase [Firmicutes bacterium HGW-Firmicutes-14]|nr:MAG: D-alanyl-D-alanine carboxypeptidase [Firmicutes bacterium HGW-Firmicutes-14]
MRLIRILFRPVLLIVITILFFAQILPAAANDKISVSADAAVLLDARTGQVLYAKNPFKQRPPASTTKVVTALLAIEAGDLGDKVTVSPGAAATEGSSIYLSAGEVLSLSDLLYGALLKSGNDACEAIAEHIGGSIDKFAALMNFKALSLGAVNTHFANPHGLPDKEHYTCAYDLALFARNALANPTFSEIVSTKGKTIDWPGKEWDRKLKNTNKLLWRYLWADGVKTGTTNAAGQCLIASASKDNRQLIAVVLRSGDRWNDSVNLFEYGFNNYSYSQVAVAGAEFSRYMIQGGSRDFVEAVYETDLGILKPANDPKAPEKRVIVDFPPEAPVYRGQVLGSINYYINGCFAGRVNLVAGSDVKKKGIWRRLLDWL